VVIDLLSQHAGGNLFAHYPKFLREEFEALMAQVKPDFFGYLQAAYWPYEMSKLGKSDLIREWFREAGLTCATHGIPVHDGRDPTCLEWERIVAAYSDLPWLRYVTSASQIRQAKKDGVLASYGHWQPSEPVPNDLRALDAAYGRGLRSFMLTYNRMNNIGVGCTERVDAGLSEFGVSVVKHCNEIGLMVDVSHCGHLTTLDACRHSRGPVNANHTCARSLSHHARGKSNEALRAIAETGGIIGVVALPAFLTERASPTIEHMLDHIDYIADLVGVQHLALGTDWPLQAPEKMLSELLSPRNTSLGFREKDRLNVTQRLEGFDDVRDLPNITRGLVKRGYSDDEIRGILGENALRVFGEVCG
jgi:membrane dipeptidase